MELDSVSKVKFAFLRLVGTEADDPELVLHGESVDEVIYLYLTRGSRAAQRYMLENGYQGWVKRSAALTWSGSDAADGGRHTDLPTDFLRAYGHSRMSALEEADGDRWGSEIRTDEEYKYKGDGYYFRGEELWLTRQAESPATVYLRYHYKHTLWSSGVTIDFPMDARPLIVAEAADLARNENWTVLEREDELRIDRALDRAQKEARDLCRPSKQPRVLRRPPRFGSRW